MKRGAQLLVSGLALVVLAGAFSTITLTPGSQAEPAEDVAPPEWNPNPPNMKQVPGVPAYEKLGFEAPVARRMPTQNADTVWMVLFQGECFKEVHVCSIPEIPPVADILFDFDLTGSMGQELENLKTNSVAIMNAIRGEVSDCNFGLISGEDYDASYPYDQNCGYFYEYGFGSDDAYRLDMPLTGNTDAVRAAIDAMALGFGQDCPESYARRFFEAVAELLGIPHPEYGPIGWREEAKKIILSFNDAVPHDCDWTACSGVPPSGDCVSGYTSGRDPGRDGLINTADDVVLMEALMELAAQNISLVDVYSGASSLKVHWDCWTERTPGGGAFKINPDGTIPGGISIDSFVVDIIKSTFDTVNVLAPGVCSGETVFVASVNPPSYENVPTPGVVEFEFEFCVPEDMEPGTHCFDICYLADGGEVRRQTFCIEVVEPTTFLDIKPGSCPNPLNVKSQGVLPAALLGRAGLDVRTIDVSSVRLEGVAPIRSQISDVGTPYYRKEGECDCIEAGPDGFEDLTLKFRTQDIVAALGEVEDRDTLVLVLTANSLEGELLEASDCMVIIHNEWRKLNPPGGDIQVRTALSSGRKMFGITCISPNPTYGQVSISYGLPVAGDVTVSVYDLAGRLLKTLRAGIDTPGEHTVDWDGRDAGGKHVAGGVYLCVLDSGNRRDVANLILLR